MFREEFQVSLLRVVARRQFPVLLGIGAAGERGAGNHY